MKKTLLLLLMFIGINTFAQAPDLHQCDHNNSGTGIFNLTVQTPILLNGNSANDYTVNYFLTQTDATNNANPIFGANAFMTMMSPQMIFARVDKLADATFQIYPFALILDPTPVVPDYPDLLVCGSYSLPQLPSGQQYYTSPNGTSSTLSPGTMITASTTIYVFAQNGNCTAESSFVVTVNPMPPTPIIENVTDSTPYVLPELPFGNYYTGPGGTGTMLSPGTTISQSTRLYVFVGTMGCSSETSFVVYILSTPSISPLLQDTFFCTDNPIFTLDSGVSDDYFFQWYYESEVIPGATQSSYTGTLAGNYSLSIFLTPNPDDQISIVSSIGVYEWIPATPPEIILWQNSVEVVGLFIEHSTYSLDGGVEQSSNIFYDVDFGTHTVTCVDTICGTVYNSTFTIELPDTPLGQATQTFTQGQTLANLQVEGQNIQWYMLPNGEAARADELPLPLTTLLVDGTTYYASQTVNGFESTSRLPVTVSLTLGLDNMVFENLKFHPNPVKNTLEISNASAIDKVSVYNLLGQLVQEKATNSTLYQMDLSAINSGVYLVKIQSENNEKTVRIVKE